MRRGRALVTVVEPLERQAVQLVPEVVLDGLGKPLVLPVPRRHLGRGDVAGHLGLDDLSHHVARDVRVLRLALRLAPARPVNLVRAAVERLPLVHPAQLGRVLPPRLCSRSCHFCNIASSLLQNGSPHFLIRYACPSSSAFQ